LESDSSLLLSIGSITKSHGIEGEFIVNLYSKEISFKNNIREVWLGESLSHTHSWSVTTIRKSAQSLFLTLRKINSIEEANYLKGLNVYLPKKYILSGYIFLVDGFNFYFSHSTSALGEIIEINNSGKQPFYIVSTYQDKEDNIILPAVADLIESIDWENKDIYYKQIDGIF